jgi:hypothetical protein
MSKQHRDPAEPNSEDEDVHLQAHASGEAVINQAGRDQHIYYGDGPQQRRHTGPDASEQRPHPHQDDNGEDQDKGTARSRFWRVLCSRYGFLYTVFIAILGIGAMVAQISGYNVKDFIPPDKQIRPSEERDEGQGGAAPSHEPNPSQPISPVGGPSVSQRPTPMWSNRPVPPSKLRTAPTPSAADAAAYANRVIRVPGPPWCYRTQVDLDNRTVVSNVEPTDDVLGEKTDLTYDGCEEGLTYRTADGMGVGSGPSDVPLTRAQCADFARSRPLTQPEPISSIKEGTVLCAITNSKAVAWIRVTYVGSPYAQDGPEAPPKPTLELSVTLWR